MIKNNMNSNQSSSTQEKKKIIYKNNHIYFVNKTTSQDEEQKKKIKEYITQLLSYINRIFCNDNIKELSYEKLYRLCYKIIISKGGEQFQSAFNSLLKEKLIEIKKNTLIAINSNKELLNNIIQLYSSIKDMVILIKKTLMYYENNYLLKNNFPLIESEYLFAFKEIFILCNISKIQNFMAATFTKVRNNTFDDNDIRLLHNIMCILNDIDINVYYQHIEKEILEQTKEFYKSKYIQLVNIENSHEQIQKLFLIYQTELSLIEKLNITKSKGRLMELFDKEILLGILLPNGQDEKIQMTIMNCIKENQNETLFQIEQLFYYKQCDMFSDLFSKGVETIGSELVKTFLSIAVKSENELIEFYKNIFVLISKIDSLLNKFNLITNTYMNKTLSKNISTFINLNNSSIVANTLPKYINIIFIQNFKNKKNMNLSASGEIEHILKLFKYINDKDIFEYQYRKYFGYRLLYSLFNEEIEINFLMKIKIECGSFYTHKCEVMYNDIKNSKNYLTQFMNSKNLRDSMQISDLVYNFQILTFANWNIKKEDTISNNDIFNKDNKAYKQFRKEFSKYNFFNFLKSFVDIYKQTHLNTVMYHCFYIGSCEITARFNKKLYVFSFSPIQTMICLLFNHNHKRKVSVKEIADIFQIKNTKKLLKTIQPLLSLKLLNLIDESNSVISLNMNFSNKQSRIVLRMKNELGENEKDTETVKNNLIKNQRKYIIESTIVRIMKGKQKIIHVDLINEVIISLKDNFLPDIQMIKNRIESLIERGYIKREDNSYIYIS